MHAIVVTGNPEVVDAFINSISTNDIRCIHLDPDGEAVRGSSGSRETVDSLAEISDSIEAAFILAATDDGEIEMSSLVLANELPSLDTPVFATTHFMTATELSSLSGNQLQVIGIGFVPGFSNLTERIEVAPGLQVRKEIVEQGVASLKNLVTGEVELVEDRPGLVGMRILSMIINEATFALMEGVADAEDIDTAMKLGTNYPLGPLEWCDRIGSTVILHVLNGLQSEYGEERYRPSLLLKQHVRAARTFYPNEQN